MMPEIRSGGYSLSVYVNRGGKQRLYRKVYSIVGIEPLWSCRSLLGSHVGNGLIENILLLLLPDLLAVFGLGLL